MLHVNKSHFVQENVGRRGAPDGRPRARPHHGPGPGVRDDQTSEGSPHLLDCDVARICFGNVFSGDCTRLVTIDFYRLVPKFAGIRLNWINNVKWTWTLIRRIHWMW